MTDLATTAYALASAVLGPTDAAIEAAIAGVRLGGRSPASVLGHTRAAALARADAQGPPDIDRAAPDDLAELARLLGCSRPAVERAVVDLDARHGLDRAALGHAIGLAPAAAAALAAEVTLAWQRELDPALLARLGPGGCSTLAGIVEAAGLSSPAAAGDALPGDEAYEPYEGGGGSPVDVAAGPTVADVLAASDRVGAHAAECAVCGDRLRAMVSVRTLLAQAPMVDPPRPVVDALLSSRSRPSGPPPPLAPGDEHAPRRPPLAVAAIAALIVVALAAGGFALTRSDGDGERVDRLSKVPAAGADPVIAVSPSTVTDARGEVTLSNLSERELRWTATPDQSWLQVAPAVGQLAPGRAIDVVVRVAGEAPEGPLRGVVTFEGADGSTTAVRVETIVGHAPDIAAEAAGCAVTADVSDESAMTSVVLWWRDGAGAVGSVPMAATAVDGEYQGTAPTTATTWWVTATDGLGNEGATQERGLTPPCA